VRGIFGGIACVSFAELEFRVIRTFGFWMAASLSEKVLL